MRTGVLQLNAAQRRLVLGLSIVAGLEAALVVRSLVEPGPASPRLASNRGAVSPAIRVRDYTLTYYRAPEHATPAENLLDPYDSFLKDANGDLIITPTGTNKISNFAQAMYAGYNLKTHKGTTVTVYQETPSRSERHKSNCHGLTFLDGDYWLLGTQVEKILADNGWDPVDARNVRSGDVAVYRKLDGTIVHTARVVGHDTRGVIRVNSKSNFEPEQTGVTAESVVPE